MVSVDDLLEGGRREALRFLPSHHRAVFVTGRGMAVLREVLPLLRMPR